MKILITGGAGFIGSHLCDKYTKEGHTVICMDNFMSGNLMNIRHLLDYRNFKLMKGDIRDFDLLEKIMRDVDVVFHLAAQIHVDKSYIEPKLTYEVNVMGTQNVLEVARIYDAKKVIYASTSEVYGSSEYSPMNENHPLNAPHPYGASKIAADRMCYAYIQTYGMDISIVRCFNIFGPRQRDFGYGGVISIFTRRVLSNVPPIIYGDGEQTRDFTFVKDVVNANILALERGEGVFNIASGSRISINELADKIIAMYGKSLKPIHESPRPGDVKHSLADISKAEKELRYKPEYVLEEGLRETIGYEE